MASTDNDDLAFPLPDMSGLSEAEKLQVMAVMKRAQEFEAKEEAKLQQKAKVQSSKPATPSSKPAPMEGQLLKFTNVMKGFQFRWFVLDPDSGMLEYFEKEEHKKQRPRGSVHLAAAVVSPSEEDSQTFLVNAANGELFKLRAADAKERQLWVDRLRSTAEYHTANFAQGHTHRSNVVRNKDSFRKSRGSHESLVIKKSPRDEAFQEVREFYLEAEDYSRHLDDKIGALPASGSYMNALDADLLLLKATSTATLQCIQDCINILQMADMKSHHGSKHTGSRLISPSKIEIAIKQINSVPGNLLDLLPSEEDEVEDEDLAADKELEGVEEHKSVILHLLSQLKLGMDLTKVVLPTFILERRSLLEMFADYMAHPDFFIKIPEIPDPEGRMLAVMEWYLTSFHSGRQGSVAKKPYNPIIGETFHCSWHVKDSKDEEESTSLMYTAEQVSHHPPISAFYIQCPSKNMRMNASIYTKSKFMGMSIGVSLVGKVCLWLDDLGEEYVFGMPSAYARSILTVPWVELGDKVALTCEKTGLSANVVFITKPFYGGKLNHITAEAKNKTGEVFFKAQGEWNGTMEFTYPKNPSENKTVDVNKLKIYRKFVRPIEKQNDHESRKLWQHVTKALKLGDVATATEHKTMLEEIQREGERHRKENSIEYLAKFFNKIEGVWVHKSLPSELMLPETKKSSH